MSDKCLYCDSTGYIHTEDNIPDQMCPHCEIGQAVIIGYNYARELGIQACDTLEGAKNERIKELEAALEEIGLTNSPKEHWEIAERALKG